MKKIINSMAYGLGKCFALYCFFAIPMIWAWFPLIAIEHYLSKKGD